jgi:hypothetical protein
VRAYHGSAVIAFSAIDVLLGVTGALRHEPVRAGLDVREAEGTVVGGFDRDWAASFIGFEGTAGWAKGQYRFLERSAGDLIDHFARDHGGGLGVGTGGRGRLKSEGKSRESIGMELTAGYRILRISPI